MIVFRLSSAKYSHELSGKGAEKFGGRWNSKGVPMLYTSSSRALSMAELAVHIPMGIIPRGYCMVSIELPPHTKIEEFDQRLLPEDWTTFPHSNATQKEGDKFIHEAKHLVLKVPSAVVRGDFNYLINPNHKNISAVKVVAVETFEFDSRLFVR